MAEKDKTLTFTRILDAPSDVVFRAWIESKRVAQWWGPHGFTNPVCELDARPDGAILIHMQGPDGNVYPMKGVFHEITPNERLVFTSIVENAEGETVLEVLNTVTFAEHSGKTTMTLHAKVVKATAEAAPMLAGMEEGWTQTLDRLAEELVKHSL